ncbi:MAG: Zn-ribbon domain-containing OB-fold protein [Tepidiformaceae bacterium]
MTNLDRPYWEAARARRLVVQACGQCGKTQWPPEEICSQCHAVDREWVEASGKGTVFSWTRVWHAVHPALQGQGPYLVVVVEVEGHPVLMIGNLLGDPERPVAIGMPVEVVFEDRVDGHTLVQWRRTE